MAQNKIKLADVNDSTGTGKFVFDTSPSITTSIDTGSVSFTAFAGATTLLTIGGTGASASMFAPSTLDASSSITGAIRTSGGISAAKSANIGTTLTVGTGYQIGGAATSNKILKGNGTNFVASTETYAAPGTSGNVMTSDGTNWTSAAPTGGGDNVVFIPAGAFVPGANCTLGAGGTTAWIPVASFADGAQGRALVSAKVPKGCSGITSIEVIYQNEVASTLQLYLEYETASLNLDSLPSAVNSDTNGGVAQYASDSTNGNIAKVTVPAAAYNGLTNVDADDLITMRINREGANANDTYGTTWSVIGVVFTFTAI